MSASSSFGPECSSTWTASTFAPPAAPRSGTGAGTTSGAAPPDASAAKLFGRKATRNGPPPVNVVLTSLVPPNTGVVTTTTSPCTAMSVLFVSTGLSSFTDSRLTHVAALVGLREHDQVGRIAAVDDGLHRRRAGDAGQVPAEIAGGVDLRRPVLAERRRRRQRRRRRRTPSPTRRPRGPWSAARASPRSARPRRPGRTPRRWKQPCRRPRPPQMTLSLSRNSTILV